ncbi:DUF4184 family protein [Arthrobacter sp. UM1]|uniref:DUF4184 family protein n=1 Tax=Arthrobacter sp. UM1 TaxID=2766776 RepID=UPI001CF6273F|nr:DUF4184 family protein [Arthrobacter sp. UM1]MCB4208215.1 DUF4184 family protein [Arthrobacter sp. UM1]
MPLTMAHPLAVYPFRRTGLMVSGMAVGSMVPDLAHFAEVPGGYGFAHSIPGLLTLDLVAGLLLLAAWQWILAPAYDEIMPARWRRWPQSRPRWQGWLPLASASVLLGGLTHLGWDLLAHWDSPVVAAVPALRAEVGPFRVFALIQYGSSALGLAALALLGWRRWTTTPARAAPENTRWAWSRDVDRAVLTWAPLCAAAAAMSGKLVMYALLGWMTKRTLAYAFFVETSRAALCAAVLAAGVRMLVLWGRSARTRRARRAA